VVQRTCQDEVLPGGHRVVVGLSGIVGAGALRGCQCLSWCANALDQEAAIYFNSRSCARSARDSVELNHSFGCLLVSFRPGFA
jgi:hypothetical protein